MSHFTTVRVQLKNREVLKATLEQLGHQVVENGQVRSDTGKHQKADLVVKRPNGYDIGFKQVNDELVMIADFWASRTTPEHFLAPIRQTYARNLLIATARSQGFSVEVEETTAAGEMRVVLGRWA